MQKNVNGTITNFLWEKDNLAYELDENLNPIRRYVYGMGKDEVKGHVEFSEAQNNVFDEAGLGWYSYIKDQVGTITQVYSRENYSMAETRTYDVFGNLINKTGSSNCNLGFQGKYFDQESGLYYYYHRYYYQTIGRFINEDPIGLAGGLNLYGFVRNNPIKWIDPFGLSIKKFFEKIFGNDLLDQISERNEHLDPSEKGLLDLEMQSLFMDEGLKQISAAHEPVASYCECWNNCMTKHWFPLFVAKVTLGKISEITFKNLMKSMIISGNNLHNVVRITSSLKMRLDDPRFWASYCAFLCFLFSG